MHHSAMTAKDTATMCRAFMPKRGKAGRRRRDKSDSGGEGGSEVLVRDLLKSPLKHGMQQFAVTFNDADSVHHRSRSAVRDRTG